ncbi:MULTISPECIES: DUF3224 domain-containing protein [Streptomyces]|uniref:DUF3224 domain-containing protein n=2 Tax=Streptomyces TaxID=1883 RepID=A0A2N8PHX5_STRNR|nr:MULTISPECIES: DUF3224 domain-containing protein [Streptomyces]PNE40580.1 hypothetical protein AOB60_06750 [Streptomyces noursei]SHM95235.1 Protein of unknown function [Streptomyces yunnanensis]
MTDQQVERTVQAEFKIVELSESVYDEHAEGPKMSRVLIRKRYEGVIEGTGVAEVLTAQGSAGGGYVASERIEGTLDGRQGTFVIQHWGLADGADQSSAGSIVPNSGTGELAGITGRAMEREFQVLTLVYML